MIDKNSTTEISFETGASNDIDIGQPRQRATETEQILPSETTETPETTTYRKYYLRHVHTSDSPGSLHFGTEITLNGPVYITSIGRKEILSIEQKLNSEKNSKGKSENKIKKMKGEIVKWLTPTKCFFLDQYGVHFISEDKLDDMNENLPNFKPREYFGDEYNCSYQCISFKTKVRFVIPKDILFTPSWYYTEHFYKEFIAPKIINPTATFNDVYYNYIIGECGVIYEGRSLTCPFNEPFLKEDHSSIITVGLPYCHPKIYEKNVDYEFKKLTAIWELLDKLIKIQILSEDYLLEFPDWCKGTLLSELIYSNTDRVSLHDNNFYNITSENIHSINLTSYENHVNLYVDECRIADAYKAATIPFQYNFTFFSDCLHHQQQCPNVKSTVRFLILKDFIFWEASGYASLVSKMYGRTSIFKGIFYNHFFLSNIRPIYEGRSLTCPFSEPFLTEDHSSLIIAAIPYCVPGFLNQNITHTFQEIRGIKHLLNTLSETGVLTDNFTVELPDVCKFYTELPNETFSENINITFHRNDYYNISSELNPETFKKILFLNKGIVTNTSLKSKNSFIRRETLNLVLPVHEICRNARNFPQSVGRIKIRFLLSKPFQSYLLPEIESSSVNLETSFRNLMTEYNDVNEGFKFDTTNYIISKDRLFQVAPLNCSFDLKNGSFVINIYIQFYESSTGILDEDIVRLSKHLEVIATDIRNYTTYTHVDFEFGCHGFKSAMMGEDMAKLFKKLVGNVSYIGFNKTAGHYEYFTDWRDCRT